MIRIPLDSGQPINPGKQLHGTVSKEEAGGVFHSVKRASRCPVFINHGREARESRGKLYIAHVLLLLLNG